MMRILITLLLTFFLIYQSQSISGVLELNSPSFDKAKDQFSKLVVYFYSKQCSFCTQFEISYLTTAIKMQQNSLYSDVQFAKMSYQSTNAAKIFEEYHIDAVPTLKIFIEGMDSKAVFSQLVYDQFSVAKLEIFIGRTVNPGLFKELSSLDNDIEYCLSEQCQRIIVKCSDHALIDAIISSPIYHQLLQVQMLCISGSSALSLNQLIFRNKKTEKKFSKCSESSLGESKLSQDCKNFVINMRHYWIESWNPNHVSEIYENKQMVFILLHGNDTNSRAYLKEFVKIKQKWNQEEKFYKQLLPIFVNADKDYDRQEYLKIKKFVGGYRSNGQQYPLPLLTCLKLSPSNQSIIKLLYQSRHPSFRKSQLTMQQWMSGIHTSSISQPYYRNYHFKQEILNNEDQQLKSVDQLILASAQDNKIYLSNLNTLIKWFSFFKKPEIYEDFIQDDLLFVLYTCKTDMNLSIFVDKVRKWFAESKKNVQFIYIDYLENDLPPGVYVHQFPVLLVYQKDNLYEKHEGYIDVKELEKVIDKMLKLRPKKQIL